MKALVTGANGTLGTVLVRHLNDLGIETVIWDRSKVPVDDYHKMESFVLSTGAKYIFHLAIASRPTGADNEFWTVNYEWPSELAWICRMNDLKFIFTSTAMVFSDEAKGPFTVESVPDAHEEYGKVKRLAEQRVLSQDPDSLVVRLGWHIGKTAGSNNMVDFCENEMKTKGKIEASCRWFPACSFLEDTAAELTTLALEKRAGLCMIDSNIKWDFYEIVAALNVKQGGNWKVEKTESFVYDQRLIDPSVPMPPLAARLQGLR